MKYLFIDIRQSDEVYQKRFGESPQYQFYNIPMNMIRFNKKTILDHLEYIDEIYIVCHPGRRSECIKNKYFQENPKIKVNNDFQFKNMKHGDNPISLDNNGNALSYN